MADSDLTTPPSTTGESLQYLPVENLAHLIRSLEPSASVVLALTCHQFHNLVMLTMGKPCLKDLAPKQSIKGEREAFDAPHYVLIRLLQDWTPSGYRLCVNECMYMDGGDTRPTCSRCRRLDLEPKVATEAEWLEHINTDYGYETE